MTNAIDKAEVTRVDAIHRALDHWNAVLRNDTLTQGYQISKEGRKTIHFSPAEIRDWPKVKAALVAATEASVFGYHLAWHKGNALVFHSNALSGVDAYLAPAVARGLCMYRQSAAYLAATGGAKEGEPECIWGFHTFNNDDHDLCAKCRLSYKFLVDGGREAAEQRLAKRHTGPTAAEVREAYVKPEPKRADPYEAWRLRGDDGYHRELMDRLDANSGRRARLVAALAAEQIEHARKFEPRFPHEGRSERALPRSNGR